MRYESQFRDHEKVMAEEFYLQILFDSIQHASRRRKFLRFIQDNRFDFHWTASHVALMNKQNETLKDMNLTLTKSRW